MTVAEELTITKDRTLDAMKTMASAMTHDFNSILTTIVYSIELALEDISEDTLTYQDLSRVLEASVEASEYIGTIMSFCKPAKSGFVDLDVQQLANSLINKTRGFIPQGIEFNCDILNEEIQITADPEQMMQIVEHLIENAVQAGDRKSGLISFSVSLGSMPDNASGTESCLVVSVSDSGSGIPQDVIPKIFDPFFTTKSKALHKGLGLSIVHSFVDNHKGVVKVSSVAGEHTTFDIYLPVIKSI